mmetsp:Transcript_30757/g.30244  ORF Transcript_30757/g.30244 Transcript_30757/m.30244 type:complete len:139 (-) Transcript_30757:936-1352(-)
MTKIKLYLVNQQTNDPVPLKSIMFSADITQSIAELEMVQEYENNEANPIETSFLFPMDIEAAISKLRITFTLKDGSKTEMESNIEERKKAEAKYSDAIAQRKTAVVGGYTKTRGDFAKITIGNFPEQAKATLTVKYYQ